MFKILIEILKNGLISLKLDINGNNKKITLEHIIFLLIPIISLCLVYFKHNTFIQYSSISTILSLFSALMFGVLIKIPDKFKDIEKIIDNDIEKISNKQKVKYTQLKNYLKLFTYTLTCSIVLAFISIFFSFLNSIFPSLTLKSINYSAYNLTYDIYEINYKVTLIFIYRFILLSALLYFTFVNQ
ncbi:hypothetical protein [Empedobacter brevis]